MLYETKIFWVFIPMDENIENVSQKSIILDQLEEKMFDRYQSNYKKLEFLTGRLLIKKVLGKLLCLPPNRVSLIKDKYGKLYLSRTTLGYTNKSDLHFNLSHSNNMLILAVSEVAEIGVDIEDIRQDHLNIMSSVFVEEEINFVKAQKDRKKMQECFYRIWTRKEARLKAVGIGLSISPLSFSVPVSNKEVEVGEFLYYTFSPKKNYLASITIINTNKRNFGFTLEEVSFNELIK